MPFVGGETKGVGEVVDFVANAEGIEGVTFSGGEPFAQSQALVRVLDGLAERCPGLTAMSYSGYTLEWLQESGSAAQHELLARLDLLVDGQYLPDLHTDLRWRGSHNQRVHILTERYRHLEPSLSDRGRWIEVDLEADGSVAWSGIPPLGFRAMFENAMSEAGIDLRVSRERPGGSRV